MIVMVDKTPSSGDHRMDHVVDIEGIEGIEGTEVVDNQRQGHNRDLVVDNHRRDSSVEDLPVWFEEIWSWR